LTASRFESGLKNLVINYVQSQYNVTLTPGRDFAEVKGMKKFTMSIVLVGFLVAAGVYAQTPGLLERIESLVTQLVLGVGQSPPTQGGIGERIESGLTLVLNAKPPPLPSNVVCIPDQNCSPLIQAAIDKAADGAVVTINEGAHLVSSPIRIYKPLHLKGAGKRRTVLTHKVNIGYQGTGGIIHTGKDDGTTVSGITLSEFTLRADRVANPTMRTIGIRVRNGTSDVVIRDMHFDGITSSPVLLIGRFMKNLQVINCRANEYYEQFVEASLQHSSDVLIAGNTAKSTKGHPSLGPVEPFPVALTPGHTGNANGLIDRVWILGNTFDHRGMLDSERTNTAGIQLSQDQASRGYQFGFQNIHIVGNKIFGQARAVRIQLFRTSGMPTSPPSYVTIEGNDMSNHTYEPISIESSSGVQHTANDFVMIGRNNIALRGHWNPYVFKTAATVVKYRNSCTNVKSTTQPCN
jgi:hypothetical protein